MFARASRPSSVLNSWTLLWTPFLIVALLLTGCDSGGGGMEEEPDSPPSTSPETVLSFVDEASAFVPGTVVRIRVENGSVSADSSYAGTVEGRDVRLAGEAGNHLAFFVPEVASGGQTLQVTLRGKAYPLDFTVASYEPIADPAGYASDLVENLAGTLSAMEEAEGDAEVATRIREVRASLLSGRDEIAALSPEEQANLARYLHTSFGDAAAGKRSDEYSEAACNLAIDELGIETVGIGGIVESIKNVGVGAATGASIAAILGLPVASVAAGVALAVLVKEVRDGIRAYDAVIEDCPSKAAFALQSEVGSKAGSSSLAFEHDVAQSFQIEATYDVGGEARSAMDEFVGVLDAVLSVLPTAWTDAITSPETERAGSADVSTFTLTAIDDDRIAGSAHPDGDRIALSFAYKAGQMPDADQTFAFELVSDVYPDQPLAVSASLAPIAPPVAHDQDAEALAGEAMTGRLTAEGAEEFAIEARPERGQVTLTDAAAGTFEYTANSGYEGADSFTFTASNEAGASNVATVSITVSPPAQPAELTIVSGNNQVGASMADLPEPLVVQALDAEGNPVSGGRVVWTLGTPYHPYDPLYYGAINGLEQKVVTLETDASGRSSITRTLGRAGNTVNPMETTAVLQRFDTELGVWRDTWLVTFESIRDSRLNADPVLTLNNHYWDEERSILVVTFSYQDEAGDIAKFNKPGGHITFETTIPHLGDAPQTLGGWQQFQEEGYSGTEFFGTGKTTREFGTKPANPVTIWLNAGRFTDDNDRLTFRESNRVTFTVE